MVVEHDGGAIVQERGTAHVEGGISQTSDCGSTAVGDLCIVEREVPTVDVEDRAASVAIVDCDICSVSERDACMDARPIWG